MARYALCVGINEFKSLPRSSWLSGCVNDANDMAKALKKLGFTARNIQVLRDREATKKKVMAALTGIVGSCGARLPDSNSTTRFGACVRCASIAAAHGTPVPTATVVPSSSSRAAAQIINSVGVNGTA